MGPADRASTPGPTTVADDFPLRYARTQRFTRGRARTVTVSPDGERVWFLSSGAGDDGTHHLFLHTTADGRTRRLVDAGPDAGGRLTDAERARRERLREGGGGIVGYATDHAARRATFVLGGVVHVVDDHGNDLVVVADGAMFDPRLSPDGRRLAGVVGGGVHLADLPADLAVAPPDGDAPDGDAPDGDAPDGDAPDGDAPVATARRLIGPGPDEDAVSWGVAEFVAAEEMGRQRGFWFAPDGQRLLVARVDEADVAVVHLAEPAEPTRPPRRHRYPFAGTTNATVDLHLLDLGDDAVTADRVVAPPPDVDAEYLVDVSWDAGHPALVTWQDRAQTRLVTTALDDDAATVAIVAEVAGEPWVEPVPGAPCWAGPAVVTVEDRLDLGPEGTRAVVVDGRALSPPGLQVRSVLDADEDRVVVRASRDDPTTIGVYAVGLADGAVTDMVADPGVHTAWSGGATVVTASATMAGPTAITVTGPAGSTVLPDHAQDPGLDVDVSLRRVGPHGLHCGLLVPPGDGPFPVLLDPYGGPHAQRVLRARDAWLVPAWFAAQGYAVLVTDNRGAPGRSPRFEHAIRDDLAAVVLADQVEVLQEVAASDPRLDVGRVAIRGWSFGGLMAGLAALRRPDLFRAAIVGAPVTEQRLYDTHYTERYLGHPDEAPAAYRASSLVDADGRLVAAAETDRPTAILLIHGMVDDNVVAANSLRLSRALLAAGHPHQFLPLSGVTHMTPQEEVAANLLRFQLDFLHRNV